MKTFLRVAVLIMGALLLSVAATIYAQEPMSTDQLDGRIYAPEFPVGLDWLNSLQPMTLQQFHGKIVLVYFWSMSSMDCITVVPELEQLRQKYQDELIVVGIHSPRSEYEKDSDAIRHALLRNDITIPVVNDSGSQLWNEYGMKSRPSFVLVNTAGRVIGVHEGTGVFELFDGIIAQAIPYFDADSLIGRHKIGFVPELYRKEQSLLKYPSGLVADSGGARLYLSDAGNHRILAMTTAGKIEFIVGSGLKGNQDGALTEARFNHPQGLALVGDRLYVADTENHAIREVDLTAKKVKTVADASAGMKYPRDLVALDGKLYVTASGNNQIWVVDLASSRASHFAGSGQFGSADGAFNEATMSRPSGIATDGTRLFFVESEGSAIRSIDVATGQVETLVATGLRYPQGIEYRDGMLYATDSYDQKVKVVNLATKAVSDFVGSGRKGSNDGAALAAGFYGPAGLTMSGGKLFVADCNNQQVRIVDIATQKVSNLQLSNLGKIAVQTRANFAGKEMKLPPAKLKSGAGKISIALMIPDGYRMLEREAFFVDFRSSDSKVVAFTAKPSEVVLNQATGEFEIPVSGAAGSASVTIDIVLNLRKEGAMTIYYDMIRAVVPVTFEEKGSSGFGVGVRVSAMPRM